MYQRKRGKKIVEVQDQRTWFRVPSLGDILTILGMIGGFLILFFHSVTWINKVDGYMASTEQFKAYVIRNFNKIEGKKPVDE